MPDLRARQRRDDAAGDRLADAEGIADGEHEIADLELIGIRQRQGRQLCLARFDLEHGELHALIGQQDMGGVFAPVAQHHGDLIAVLDHMVVGDDQPIGPQDHARAQRVLDPLLRHAAAEIIAEELLEEGIVEQRREIAGLDDTRREKTLTTAGAARFTTEEKL